MKERGTPRLLEIPEIRSESGLSAEFLNEFNFLEMLLEQSAEVGSSDVTTLKKVLQFGAKKSNVPFRRYRDCFPPTKFVAAVDEKNAEQVALVARIDAIVDNCNAAFRQDAQRNLRLELPPEERLRYFKEELLHRFAEIRSLVAPSNLH